MTDILCVLLCREQEVRHARNTDFSAYFIRVEWDSEEYVAEMGLQKKSCFDNNHQVVSASILTGQEPRDVSARPIAG